MTSRDRPSERPDEAAGADPLESGRDELKRVRTSAAARALAKLPRRSRFVPRDIACHPSFSRHNAYRLMRQRARVLELAAAHGGVSRAVGDLVAAASWLYAAGECAAEMAAQKADLKMFKIAASLTESARVQDQAAWEAARREARSRSADEDTDAPRSVQFERAMRRIAASGEKMNTERGLDVAQRTWGTLMRTLEPTPTAITLENAAPEFFAFLERELGTEAFLSVAAKWRNRGALREDRELPPVESKPEPERKEK